MAARQRYELWVGVLLAAAMVLLAWMAVMVGAVGGLGPQVRVTVKMKDAAGIAAGASVQVYGVEVGRVERMELAPDGAIAHVAIQTEAGLRRDVTPQVRARSVLGEKYLELQPHSIEADLLTNGDELTVLQPQYEIDELVNQAGTVLQGVKPEVFGEALGLVSQELAADPTRLKRFFDNLDVIIANTAEASKGFPQLVTHADATLSRADVFLDDGSALVTDARRSLSGVNGLVDEAGSSIERLPKLVDDAIVTLEGARATLKTVDEFVAAAQVALKTLEKKATVVIDNFSEIDKWEIRRLLREEGILIRIHPDEVVESETRSQDVVPPARRHSEK